MANQELLDLIRQGADVWNAMRSAHPDVQPDFSNANLMEANLKGFDLRRGYLYRANLQRADLRGAILRGADLREADLHEADLSQTDLCWATLYGANLRGAILNEANLQGADLRKAALHNAQLRAAYLRDVNFREAQLYRADLTSANLTNAVLVETNLEQAKLIDCYVYGISVWNPKLTEATQKNLVITRNGEPTVTVDDLEVAQFIYLLMDNQKLRNVINTVTSKAVLILGRFTPERKAILDALRKELRQYDLVPILFDFDKPPSRNLTETVAILANMARFVIADLTDPRSIPQELQRIIPDNPSLPIQPVLLSSQDPYAMFGDFLDYPWVLKPYQYNVLDDLLASLKEKVVSPAIAKAKELEERRKAIDKEMRK